MMAERQPIPMRLLPAGRVAEVKPRRSGWPPSTLWREQLKTVAKPRVDKDAIIADMQSKLAEAKQREMETKEQFLRLSKESTERLENGLAWKKAAEESRRELSGCRDRVATADFESAETRSALRFAEGYIAASGDWQGYQSAAYPKQVEPRGWGEMK